MKKWLKQVSAISMAVVLGAGMMLTGCGSKADDTSAGTRSADGKTVLKMMLQANKPTGWDEVKAAVEEKLMADGLNIELDVYWVAPADYKDKLNLSITGGEKWDLVFDAPFVHLRNLAADGYYADLSQYWNNDEYPGLKECFSEVLIKNNEFYGQQCVIPLLRTYGTGIRTVFYRQDWADAWGIGAIDSYDKLVQYWDAVKTNEPGVYPLGVTGSRGFFELLNKSGTDLAKNGIAAVRVGNMVNTLYIQDNQVVSVAAEGAGDEAFKDFPEGYNYDFGVERYEQFAEWRNMGYTETDALAQTDANTLFYSGLSGSIIGTLDDVEKIFKQMSSYSSDASIGYFVYEDDVREKREGAITTGYQANNFLCIPKNSENIDGTMQFLNWIFSSEENHDLLELGIEGTDYKDNGDGTYSQLSQYNFPGYMLTWTSKYVKFPDNIPAEILEYKKYELKDETFVANVLPSFVFDGSKLATETAQVKAITDRVNTVRLHGITNDGTTVYNSMKEMLKANADEVMVNGGQIIQDEVIKQVNEYLSSR